MEEATARNSVPGGGLGFRVTGWFCGHEGVGCPGQRPRLPMIAGTGLGASSPVGPWATMGTLAPIPQSPLELIPENPSWGFRLFKVSEHFQSSFVHVMGTNQH